MLQIEDLVFADLRRRRLVLDDGGVVRHLDVRERVRAASIADKHRIALRVVASARRLREHLHAAAIRVVSFAGRDALRDDVRACVLADVDHFRTGVGLLTVIDYRHAIELTNRVVTLQNHARIFPGDRRSGLDLRPGNLRVGECLTALGYEVINPAAPLFVSRVPVLHGRVFDGRPGKRHQLDDGGVQLVRAPLRRRAALQIAHICTFIRDDQCSLKLPGIGGVDAEVRRQLHGAANALRHVHERAVREHRAVQRREEVVAVRHDRAEILTHQVRMLAQRLAERHEDDAELPQLLSHRCADRHRVEDRIDGDAGEHLLLVERNA